MADAMGDVDPNAEKPSEIAPLASEEVEDVGDEGELQVEVPAGGGLGPLETETDPDTLAQVPNPQDPNPFQLPAPLQLPLEVGATGSFVDDGDVRSKGAQITYRRQKPATVGEISALFGEMSLTSPTGGGEVLREVYREMLAIKAEHERTLTEFRAVREEGDRARRDCSILRSELAAAHEEIDALRSTVQATGQSSVLRDPQCDAKLLRLSVNPLPESDWPSLNPQLAQYLQNVGTWPMSPSEGGLTPDLSGGGMHRPTPPPAGRGRGQRVSPQTSGASPELPGAETMPASQGRGRGERGGGRPQGRGAPSGRRVSWFPNQGQGGEGSSMASPVVSASAQGRDPPSADQPACEPDVYDSLLERLGAIMSEVRTLQSRREVPTSTPAVGYAHQQRSSYRPTSYVNAPSPVAPAAGLEGLGQASTAPAATYGGDRTLPLPPNTRLASGTVGGEVVVSSDVNGPALIGVHLDDRSVYPIGEMDPLGYFVGRRQGSPITQGWGPADDPRMTAQLDLTYTVGAGYGFGRPEDRYQGEPVTEFGGKEKEQRFRHLGKLVRLDFPQMNNVDEAYLWTQWHAKFIGYARALRLSYEEMGYTLALYLSQCVKAAQAVATLPPVLASDYNTLVTLSGNLFCPSGRAAAAQARLNARVQSGETAHQFAAQLLKLVESAYPCSRVAYTSERRQEAALRRFCEGLSDRTLALRIMDRRCTTIQQGLTLVDEYAVNMRSTGVAASVVAIGGADLVESDSCSDVSEGQLAIQSSDVLAVTRKDSQVRSNGPAVPSDGRRGKLSKTQRKKQQGPKKPAQGTPTSSGTVVKSSKPNAQAEGQGAQPQRECWSCGRIGHLMRQCKLKSGRRIWLVTCDDHLESELPEDF